MVWSFAHRWRAAWLTISRHFSGEMPSLPHGGGGDSATSAERDAAAFLTRFKGTILAGRLSASSRSVMCRITWNADRFGSRGDRFCSTASACDRCQAAGNRVVNCRTSSWEIENAVGI